MAENIEILPVATIAHVADQSHSETRHDAHVHLLASSLLDHGAVTSVSDGLKPLHAASPVAPEAGVDRVNGQVTGLTFAPQTHAESGNAALVTMGVGASFGRPFAKPFLETISPKLEELTSKGSFLRGMTVGMGVASLEALGAVALRDEHPEAAKFLQMHPVEAGFVGLAGSMGGSNLRLRAGLIAAAVVVGKAEYSFEKLTGHGH
jgi:hypothetical protein